MVIFNNNKCYKYEEDESTKLLSKADLDLMEIKMTYEQFKVEQEQSRLYKTISFQDDFISKSKVKRRTAKKWSHRQINEYKKNICRLGKKHSHECLTNYFGTNVYLNRVYYTLDDGSIKSIAFFTSSPKTRWCTKLTINEARKIMSRLNK